MTLLLSLLGVLTTVLFFQHRAAGQWTHLLYEASDEQVQRSVSKIAVYWGLFGLGFLKLYAIYVADVALFDWMLSSGSVLAYLLVCVAWTAWCAWCIARRMNCPLTWFFNIAVSALLLAVDHALMRGVFTGHWQLLPEHLFLFAITVLLIATIIRMGMSALGFSRLPVASEINLLGSRWLTPHVVFLMACAVVDVVMVKSFWSLAEAVQGNTLQMAGASSDTAGLVGSTGLSDWATDMHWPLSVCVFSATLFAIWGSGYNRRIYTKLEDMYLWAGSDREFPKSVRGLLTNTRLIRSTLGMTRIGVVFWKSPQHHLGVGSFDLRTGHTYISEGFLHDAGKGRVGMFANLPDFWAASIHSDDLSAFDTLQEALKDPSRNQFAHIVRFAGENGKWLFVKGEASVERDDQGRPLSFYGVHIDISEQISDNTRLDLSNQRKLFAMRMLGHDMQSNLAILSMSVDLMRRRMQKDDRSGMDNDLIRMKAAVQAAMELLSDTVSMARSEDHSADAKSEDIRVRSFIQAIIDVQVERYRVEDFKIVLDCEPQMMIRSVNSFALTSLLTNLISNAIKYCPDPAGRVRVKVSGRRVDNDGGLTTVIEVEDEGIGIPPEFNKRLFQSFQRADNVSNIEGTGLGMTIVKSALDTLRGDIWVESVPVRLRGSRFVVTIPNTFERMTPQDLQSITLPL